MGQALRSTATVLLVSATTVAGGDGVEWSSLRGPNHDGSAPAGAQLDASPGTSLEVVWRQALGPGCSSVAVAGGKAVTLFSDGTSDVAAAFDAATGRELWRQVLAPTRRGHDGSFDGPLATPAVAEGKVFALGPNGHLAALDLGTGRVAWRTTLGEHRTTEPPWYGYGTSPVAASGSLVVQVGAPNGGSVVAFDMATGAPRWKLGDDGVNYQTPVVLRVSGRDQLVAAGDTRLVAVDPAAGKLLWDYEFGGDGSPISALSMVPVPAGDGRLFLKNTTDTTAMIRVAPKADGTYLVEQLWKAPVLRQSYSVPVYHDGHLYGFNGRILTAVDAATGELRWRSREPGDGWLAKVGSDLVILTKAGTLHVGAASASGWQERHRLELFPDVSWSPPSFAHGAVFARSHGEIARIETRTAPAGAPREADAVVLPATSRFARFLAEVAAAPDKKAAVDRFLATVPATPLVEDDVAVFLYRGDVQDVAIAGDMIGQRREDPMTRVPGTDLFWYTSRLERDALISYYFQRNFDELVADPLNPRRIPGPRGPGNPKEMSFFGMPAWREPSHLADAPEARRGRLVPHGVEGKRLKTQVQVLLPAGYDASVRYPVAYVLAGDEAIAAGRLPHSLAQVQGTTVSPFLAVFVSRPDWGATPPGENDDPVAIEAAFLATDVVPFVDARYPTVPTADGRAVVGQGRAGHAAATAVFAHPGTFGGLGLQSLFLLDVHEAALRARIRSAREQPLRVYLDWGLYDMRGTREGWDNVRMNRAFDAFLRERGYTPAGGQGHEGFGWASWRNRTPQVFEALFPAAR